MERSIYSTVRDWLKSLLIKHQYSEKLALSFLSTESALDRIHQRGLNVSTVIDIGASNGIWSIKARKYFPKASYFMVEAQAEHEKELSKLCRNDQHFSYIISAAGNQDGKVFFDKSDLLGGQASYEKVDDRYAEVDLRTVDSMVGQKDLKGPFLLKLDTHGFEVPIFDGARSTLKNTNLIVVETYNFKLTNDSLRFHELCAYLESQGFRCIDISEPLFRPKDRALWQFDLFFIPKGSPEFQDNHYS